MQNYESLLERVRKAIVLENLYDLLEWDQKVMMPLGALEYRAAHVGVVKGLIQEIYADPKIGTLLSQIDESGLDDDQKVNIYEIRKLHEKYKCITPELTKEINETLTKATEAWREAKAKKDFQLFLPWLEKTFALARDKGGICPEKKTYEVLLDDFTHIPLDIVERELKRLKITALKLVKENECKVIDVPKEVQRPFIRDMLEQCGFDFNKGRLDEYTHPFSVSHGRITVDYREWKKTISSALHEAGHAWYDQGLPIKAFGTPIGCQRSHAIHETQSKLWEDFIGKGEPFWTFFFPKLQKQYTPYFDGMTFEEFYNIITIIEPREKRLGSDEVTYILHIILRFEIEMDVINGDLHVGDIPSAWARKMKEYLGLEVEEHSCLQDIHWARAGIGYFPAYAVGLIGAAQFYNAMKRDYPDIEEEISDGKFDNIHIWLKENIWSHGSRYSECELIKQATGESFSADAYIDYLEKKYK